MQGAEHGQQRSRSRQGDAVIALQGLHQAGAAQHFGVQTFGGQKQNRKVGGVRRLHILFGDGFGFQADALLQSFRGSIGIDWIGAALRIEQAGVIFVRKFGVNGQPQRRAIGRLTRQFDGEVDQVFTARARRDLRRVLVGHKHLFKQGRKLCLTKNTPRLHIGQQMLEVTHALRQGLHFAKTFMNLLEPVGYLFEALAQARLQGGLQLLIHGHAHFFELGGVAALQLGQLCLQRAAHFAQAGRAGLIEFGQTACIGLAQGTELRAQGIGQAFLHGGKLRTECIQARILRTGGFGAVLHQRLLEGRHVRRRFLSRSAGSVLHLLPQFPGNVLAVGVQGL